MILLSPYLLSIFIVEGIILVLASISLFWAVKISLDFDMKNSSITQYRLATRGYLVAVIVMFILSVKLPIFLYFIWTMDSLSSIVPGAMCGAGIVSATEYGTSMLSLKIINLFLLCGWLLLNYYDLKSPKSAYMKLKFYLFQPLFLLLVLEFILEFAHFSNINTDTPVACCSIIFSQNDINSLPFYQKNWFILGLFMTFYISYLISAIFKRPILYGFLSIGFAISSIYALIRFFSPYIYQLPTHMCPFCMLQSDYYYVGYLVYILIFIGILTGWFTLILYFLNKPIKGRLYNIGLTSNTLLLLLFYSYPAIYYLKNGVWL